MWDVIFTKVWAGYTELVDDLVTEKWIQHDRANP